MDTETFYIALDKILTIRITEVNIAKDFEKNNIITFLHLCVGEEATAVGVSLALNKNDQVFGNHRSHGHYLAKGGNYEKMIYEIYGDDNGCCKGYGGSMHLIDLKVNFMGSTAIVGNSLPVGAGLALTINIEKSNKISCIFLGDGCVEEGVFHETVNFCALKKLPVLFVCENNLYSVYSSLLVRQPKNRSITKMVNAMGIKSFCVDGNDVCKIYDIALRELSKIRSGLGPRFFEFKTYRWREHCGPNFDNNIGYRSEKEFQKWKNKDPIKKYEKKLLEKKEITTEEINKININLLKRINLAFDYAEKSPFPKPSEAFKNVYAL